ncbi:MAG: hypothetical protein M1814_003565 [Vezdaea aestivalis]|nr:MAG: hypothetical protein M1814_003565 [Vezdaea aestivalis]
MSLSRAFTSRRPRRSDDPSSSAFPVPRSSSRRTAPKASVRKLQISAPVDLILATTFTSYDAPDHSHSPSSDEDSVSSRLFSARASKTSSTDSIVPSPAPNHLTAFFNPSKANGTHEVVPAMSAPAVPKRANSHTAASHQALARKRSQSRSREIVPPTSIHSQPRSSANAFSPQLDSHNHPFSRELQQVNELAEEMGLDGGVMDEEERYLQSHGLQKFSADDYLDEILGLYTDAGRSGYGALDASWI